MLILRQLLKSRCCRLVLKVFRHTKVNSRIENKCENRFAYSDRMSKYEFQPISEPLQIGTRIHWDKITDSLYFVDLPKSTVYKYEVTSGKTTKAKVGDEPLAFMFPVDGSNTKFIAALNRKFVFVEWDGKSSQVTKIETITEIETEANVCENRINGGKIDPYGRLWAGTMGPSVNGATVPHRGSLYSLDKGIITKHRENIGISNGLAWDTKHKKMYYCDTLEPKIFQFDYSDDGKISNEKVVFEFESNNLEGKPDGLTIDKNGDLWLCSIFGSALVNINPRDGKIKEKIVFPTSQITAVTFGGKDLNELFVTTAQIPVDGKTPPPPAGTTYHVKNVGATGFNGDRYKL